MPKQGQYARQERRQMAKQLHQRRGTKARGSQRTIEPSMVTDFVIVRFRLTSGKQLAKVDQESIQRFLQEFIPRLQERDFDFQAALRLTLQYVASRVPWQFFYQLSQQWPVLDHFLRRELPALPLAKPLIVKNWVSQEDLNQGLIALLARQSIRLTTLQSKLSPAAATPLTKKMKLAISDGNQVKWSAVSALLGMVPFPIDHHLDSGTQEWLQAIQKLTI
ncbi:hypothetical protein [Limosilactobacillus caecicola]|uniref:hypothetical protein n=1 Tax=Limosilactobacillus caecicola TaxID=2941332 RepID=UPI0020411F21|nr:hypothetical protein [Limosilactobacillus caecicola]